MGEQLCGTDQAQKPALFGCAWLFHGRDNLHVVNIEREGAFDHLSRQIEMKRYTIKRGINQIPIAYMNRRRTIICLSANIVNGAYMRPIEQTSKEYY